MAWFLASIAAVTAVLMLILVVVLIRHLRALAGSIERLQADLVPVLEEIQRGSETAGRRLAGMQERAAALRSGPD